MAVNFDDSEMMQVVESKEDRAKYEKMVDVFSRYVAGDLLYSRCALNAEHEPRDVYEGLSERIDYAVTGMTKEQAQKKVGLKSEVGPFVQRDHMNDLQLKLVGTAELFVRTARMNIDPVSSINNVLIAIHVLRDVAGLEGRVRVGGTTSASKASKPAKKITKPKPKPKPKSQKLQKRKRVEPEESPKRLGDAAKAMRDASFEKSLALYTMNVKPIGSRFALNPTPVKTKTKAKAKAKAKPSQLKKAKAPRKMVKAARKPKLSKHTKMKPKLEIEPERITVEFKSVQRVKKVKKEPMSDADQAVLKAFSKDSTYGPSTQITMIERYNRAVKLRLPKPAPEIRAAIVRSPVSYWVDMRGRWVPEDKPDNAGVLLAYPVGWTD